MIEMIMFIAFVILVGAGIVDQFLELSHDDPVTSCSSRRLRGHRRSRSQTRSNYVYVQATPLAQWSLAVLLGLLAFFVSIPIYWIYNF